MLSHNIQKKEKTGILARYPILSFMSITFLLSYGIGLPFGMWIFQNFELPKPYDVYISRAITVVSPGITALLVMWANKERPVLKLFLPARKLKYLYFLIPVLGLLISAITLNLGGLSFDLILGILLENWKELLIHLVLQIFIIGIGEELGWRSWLLPKLDKRYSLLKAMLLVWVIWTFWHFPVFLQAGEIVVPWLMIITGLTITLTWAWKRFGNNVLIFAVIHGSVNYTHFFWENKIDADALLNAWAISGYVYLGLGILALISMREQLKGK